MPAANRVSSTVCQRCGARPENAGLPENPGDALFTALAAAHRVAIAAENINAAGDLLDTILHTEPASPIGIAIQLEAAEAAIKRDWNSEEFMHELRIIIATARRTFIRKDQAPFLADENALLRAVCAFE